MSALISRDPFARTELHRETVADSLPLGGCYWCGGFKLTGTGKQRLYRFVTESDGGRKSPHKGLFCSRSCHTSYHS